MNSADARKVVEKHFDRDAVKVETIRHAKTPCPQTELYEREPLILKAIRTYFRPAFESQGCDCWIDDYGNLIAQYGEGKQRAKHIMFMSYAMAWAEATMPDPWSGELMDGKEFGIGGEVVWGRGGSEWHPTNVAMIETARIIKESGVDIPGRITYVISSGGHTSSSDPIYHLVFNDQLKPDLCITPGTKEIVLGNKGRLDLRVNVFGKSVHSGGELSVGTNAIEGGMEALRRLEKIMPFPPAGVDDPDMGQGRLSVIGIASYPFSPGYHHGYGSGGHTLQNLFRFLLDRRLPPGQDVEAAIDEIKEAIGDMSPFKLTFERGALQYPSKHDRESPLISSLAESYEVALEVAPEYRYVDYTIDAGFLNMSGIQTVMFGAIDMRFCHGDVEFTNLNDTYDISKVYANWAIANAR